MQAQFYHDPRRSSARRATRVAVAVLCGVVAAACGRSSPVPAGTSAPPTETPVSTTMPRAGTADTGVTPTAAAIARGRAVIELVRTAGGGVALTALRSFEATGTSSLTALKMTRQLHILTSFPSFYRQEETPLPDAKGRGLHTITGLQGKVGWLRGATLGGDGQSADPAVAGRAYARAARQAMVGLLAGVNAPWLTDSEEYTVTDGGTVTAGDDRGTLVVWFDGADGRAGRLLVDPGTRLPRRFIEPPQPSGGGAAGVSEIVFTYSDFQPHGGLQLPRTITREIGGNRSTWSITNYVINPPIALRRFSPLGR